MLTTLFSFLLSLHLCLVDIYILSSLASRLSLLSLCFVLGRGLVREQTGAVDLSEDRLVLWTATLDKSRNETNLWNFETIFFCTPVILHSSYSVLQLFCIPVILYYSSYSVLQLFCTPVILYTSYSALQLFCTPVILHSSYSALQLFCTSVILHSSYSVFRLRTPLFCTSS